MEREREREIWEPPASRAASAGQFLPDKEDSSESHTNKHTTHNNNNINNHNTTTTTNNNNNDNYRNTTTNNNNSSKERNMGNVQAVWDWGSHHSMS